MKRKTTTLYKGYFCTSKVQQTNQPWLKYTTSECAEVQISREEVSILCFTCTADDRWTVLSFHSWTNKWWQPTKNGSGTLVDEGGKGVRRFMAWPSLLTAVPFSTGPKSVSAVGALWMLKLCPPHHFFQNRELPKPGGCQKIALCSSITALWFLPSWSI